MNLTLIALDRDVTRACTLLLPSGVSTHVVRVARGLVDRGHEVTVLTGRDERDGVDLRYRHEGGGGLRLVRLSREQLQAVAGTGRVVGRDVADALEEAQPDLLHAYGHGAAVLADEAARDLEVPWVAQPDDVLLGLPPRTPDAARERRSEREMVRAADRVVALSRAGAADLVAAGVRPDAVDVVARTVDPAVFDVRGPSVPRSRTRLRVVAVVEDFGPTSGLTETITAVSRVPGAELVVVGGPPLGSTASDPGLAQAYLAARQLGVSDRLHVTGRLSPSRLAETFRSADVVVSVPWAAGFGDHVLEAMACGRAVIASAAGGALDTVEHGVTGLCIPAQSATRLADALRLMLCDKEQREHMGQLARRRVIEHFSAAHIVEDTLRCYDRTLDAHRLSIRAS